MEDNFLYAYLVNEDSRRENRLKDIERAYWWYGFDVFSTFEVLEAKIQLETFRQIAQDLYNLLRLYGQDNSNYTK